MFDWMPLYPIWPSQQIYLGLNRNPLKRFSNMLSLDKCQNMSCHSQPGSWHDGKNKADRIVSGRHKLTLKLTSRRSQPVSNRLVSHADFTHADLLLYSYLCSVLNKPFAAWQIRNCCILWYSPPFNNIMLPWWSYASNNGDSPKKVLTIDVVGQSSLPKIGGQACGDDIGRSSRFVHENPLSRGCLRLPVALAPNTIHRLFTTLWNRSTSHRLIVSRTRYRMRFRGHDHRNSRCLWLHNRRRR